MTKLKDSIVQILLLKNNFSTLNSICSSVYKQIKLKKPFDIPKRREGQWNLTSKISWSFKIKINIKNDHINLG